MSLDDVLYCKVLSVTTEEGPEGRPRHRIKLSTRDIDTDTGQVSAASISNVQQQRLSQNLNSTIGMGVALDPMSSLILKHEKSSGSLIKGYALVDDTEGEPDLPPQVEPSARSLGRGSGTTLPAWMTRGEGPGDAPLSAPARRPLGRGRGTTLPAWMTRGDASKKETNDSSSEASRRRKHDKHRRKEKKKDSRKRHRDDGERKRSRKHHRRDELKSHRHSPRESDSDDSSYDRRHRKKRHRRREDRGHGPSYSSGSDDDYSRHRRKHHRKSRRRNDSEDIGDDRYNRHPRADSESSRNGRNTENRRRAEPNEKTEVEFSSVADAERLIAELEDKKRRRG